MTSHSQDIRNVTYEEPHYKLRLLPFGGWGVGGGTPLSQSERWHQSVTHDVKVFT